MSDCIFCKIITREIPADIIFENEHIVAFSDIEPLAPTHVLVVPKQHFASLDDLPDDDEGEAAAILLGLKAVAAKLGVAGGYKVVTNCGESAGQVVRHLHFHILAGKKFVP